MISIEFKEAFAEMNEILKVLDEKEVNKIPEETRRIFNINQSQDYIPHIDTAKSLDKQGLKKETKDILVYLYVNYWCSDKERQSINKIFDENYEKKQLELRNEYNPDKIFRNNEKKNKIEEIMIVKYKQSILKRIYNFFKNIFD